MLNDDLHFFSIITKCIHYCAYARLSLLESSLKQFKHTHTLSCIIDVPKSFWTNIGTLEKAGSIWDINDLGYEENGACLLVDVLWLYDNKSHKMEDV